MTLHLTRGPAGEGAVTSRSEAAAPDALTNGSSPAVAAEASAASAGAGLTGLKAQLAALGGSEESKAPAVVLNGSGLHSSSSSPVGPEPLPVSTKACACPAPRFEGSSEAGKKEAKSGGKGEQGK